MYSNDDRQKGAVNFFLSWQFLFVKVLAVALVAVYLTRPMGSITGRIAFEKEATDLYTYAVEGKDVVAVVTGPRGDGSVERGVFVNQDGSFHVEQLQVGEYELRVRATG